MKILSALRPIGYISLLATLILMVVGLLVGKTKLTLVGAFTYYLPIFGYFAFTMFFLAGIGLLRFLWIPLIDYDPNILKLGHIVLLPYYLLAYLITSILTGFQVPTSSLYVSLVGLSLNMLMIAIIAIGAFILALGISTWLYGKFTGRDLVDFWIYKYSRHPQYLGFILWSYGLLILTSSLPVPKGGYVPTPSLPWLIVITFIIILAFLEEGSMVRKFSITYERYRNETPFIVPLPKRIARILTAPIRLIIGKNYPETLRETLLTIPPYTLVLIILSIPIVNILP